MLKGKQKTWKYKLNMNALIGDFLNLKCETHLRNLMKFVRGYNNNKYSSPSVENCSEAVFQHTVIYIKTY